MQEVGREEAIRRGTDHRVPEGSRSGRGRERVVSQARLLGGELLPLAEQVGGMDVSDARRLKTLEAENAKLKKLLAESMLENDVSREALRKKW